MSIDPKQLRRLVSWVLDGYGLNDGCSTNLVLGTIAQESYGGTYIRQIQGPALGIAQIEPSTFLWLQTAFGKRWPEIKPRRAEDLEWDLKLSILMCRLKYLSVVEPLPPDDLVGMGTYWKRYYNTPRGAGTVEQFVESYRRFVR